MAVVIFDLFENRFNASEVVDGAEVLPCFCYEHMDGLKDSLDIYYQTKQFPQIFIPLILRY